MPRSCRKRHVFEPDCCRLCWLFANDPRYRVLLANEGEIPPQESAPQRRAKCFHLGKVLSRITEGASGPCKCPRKWKRGCDMHGQTTLIQCGGCPDYEADG